MSEVVRLYQYKSLLVGRRAMSAEDLMARLEISRATLKRDIAKLRDQLHVPIEFDRDAGGYTLSQGHTDSELPGLWFNQEELLADCEHYNPVLMTTTQHQPRAQANRTSAQT